METTVNLKRNDSGENKAKNLCTQPNPHLKKKRNSPPTSPKSHTTAALSTVSILSTDTSTIPNWKKSTPKHSPATPSTANLTAKIPPTIPSSWSSLLPNSPLSFTLPQAVLPVWIYEQTLARPRTFARTFSRRQGPTSSKIGVWKSKKK